MSEKSLGSDILILSRAQNEIYSTNSNTQLADQGK